jgi:hypothetical protein
VTVFVDEGDGLMPPEAVKVKIASGPGVRVNVRVYVGKPVEVARKVVEVEVNVALTADAESTLNGFHGTDVGVKKSNAKASRVSARSRGVGVIVSLGTTTISSCVSGLPPASMIGTLNAKTHAPMIISRTTTLCDFTLLCLQCIYL